jgi:hypothetical protein
VVVAAVRMRYVGHVEDSRLGFVCVIDAYQFTSRKAGGRSETSWKGWTELVGYN